MLSLNAFTVPPYETVPAASARAAWRVEDLIGGRKQLDLSRPFLPEVLAGSEALRFLSGAERIVLNQLRGHSYFAVLGLLEELSLRFVLDHLRGEAARARAREGARRIDLSRCLRDAFLSGSGEEVVVIDPPEGLARAVLTGSPLGGALFIAMIECLTRRHWLEAARHDGAIDPVFKGLLRHQGREEAQHGRHAELLVKRLAEGHGAAELDAAIGDLLEIARELDGALARQIELDLDALEAALGRPLDAGERSEARAAQVAASRWTFLGSGMTDPRFIAMLERLSPAAAARAAALHAPESSVTR